MNDIDVDWSLIEQIAAQLDLRDPNEEALKAIAFAVETHYEENEVGDETAFEGVADVATGVGKTYVMAAAMEYFAARGHRHFAVITPGSTILNKTIGNFSPGHEKSLLQGMSFQPEMITAENFDSPRIAFEMDNPQHVKLYLFNVQALIRPRSNQARRTHEFREGLGEAFYDKVASEPGLIVFADEHHTYYGPAFSRAVRGLRPYALVGLTATPHEKTPEEQIIFRYPLAAAIADKFVKTPVIVGRKDELTDDRTKLADGVRLLELKTKAVERYVTAEDRESVNPVMLVVAQTIDDAEEYTEILERDDFFDGRYRGKVLTVHSDQSDAALEELEKVERPNSPVRIVVSVGMLKEGWDVKNVYVIASMRASVSDILTEQTLGRGLRLPFGEYTGIEMLDTLEVVAHERYAELLEKADILREDFVDHRTLVRRRATDDGGVETYLENVAVRPDVQAGSNGPEGHEGTTVTQPQDTGGAGGDGEGAPGGVSISSVEDRTADADGQVESLGKALSPREDLPDVHIPIVQMTEVRARFSLADVEPQRFRDLGRRHAADPDGELLRTVIAVESRNGEDRSLQVGSRAATDRVEATEAEVPLEDSVRTLTQRVAELDEVPARETELVYLNELIEAYVDGLGDKAETVLATYPYRAVRHFRAELQDAQREVEVKPEFGEVSDYKPMPRERLSRSKTKTNIRGKFEKGVGYEGWSKSYFPQVWFDSTPEFRFAGIADNAGDVEFWVRLQRNDIPILWTSGGRRYNPDFLVVLAEGTHVLAEVKRDDRVTSEEVQAKKEAARRWVRRVSAAQGNDWEYWIATEEDIDASGGSWSALRQLAQ